MCYRGGVCDGTSAIEQISGRYGKQAVVVSIDPRRVYLSDPSACPQGHTPIELPEPAGERLHTDHMFTSSCMSACCHRPFYKGAYRCCVIWPCDTGPNGEKYCWYQATIKGGREGRPIDAVKLARVCQDLGTPKRCNSMCLSRCIQASVLSASWHLAY